jgi:hypothetical protein
MVILRKRVTAIAQRASVDLPCCGLGGRKRASGTQV